VGSALRAFVLPGISERPFVVAIAAESRHGLLLIQVEGGRVDFLEGVGHADVPSRADDDLAVDEPARDMQVLQTGTSANGLPLAVLVTRSHEVAAVLEQPARLALLAGILPNEEVLTILKLPGDAVA
jgi:hypothetical protein